MRGTLSTLSSFSHTSPPYRDQEDQRKSILNQVLTAEAQDRREFRPQCEAPLFTLPMPRSGSHRRCQGILRTSGAWNMHPSSFRP